MKNLLTSIFLILILNSLSSQVTFKPDSTFGNNGIYRLENSTLNRIYPWQTRIKDGNIQVASLKETDIVNSSFFTSVDVATGIVNEEYGINGSLNLLQDQSNSYLYSALPLRNGGFLASFYVFNNDQSIEKVAASIITDDGKLDLNFGNNGVLEFGSFDEISFPTFTEVEDGIIGSFPDPQDNHKSFLRKMDYAGNFDLSFGNNGIVTFSVLEDVSYDLDAFGIIEFRDVALYLGFYAKDQIKGKIES